GTGPHPLKLAQQGATSGQVLAWNGSTWAPANQGGGWGLTGNSGTTAGTNFIGTTDAKDFVIKTNGTEVMRASATSSGSVHPGNVGIGTASPISLLNLSSSSLSGTGEVGITIQNTASGGGNYRVWVSDNGNGEGSDKFFILDNSSNQVRLAIDGS